MRGRFFPFLHLLGRFLFFVRQECLFFAFLRTVSFLAHDRSPINPWLPESLPAAKLKPNRKSEIGMFGSAHIFINIFRIVRTYTRRSIRQGAMGFGCFPGETSGNFDDNRAY
jgi:hypothetical protein